MKETRDLQLIHAFKFEGEQRLLVASSGIATLYRDQTHELKVMDTNFDSRHA